MGLWKKNYGTMDKTMVIYTLELRFTKGKKHCRLPKAKKLWFITKKTTKGEIPKQL